MSAGELVNRIRAELERAADPARAPAMQAYMKSAMPYLGVPVPVTRRLTLAAARDLPPDGLPALLEAAEALWRNASHREERYAAAALLTLPAARGRPEVLPLLHEFIVTGAWWDHVDEAAHRVGELLRAHPGQLTPVLRGWSTDPDRWLRRVAVIAQLDSRADTDLSLLTEAILANAADPDFFLRKAIGWALRQYARTDPAWVLAFLARHHDRLSPLSTREAAKHLSPTAG